MLGLYLDTLIIGHKSCSLLCIHVLYELALQKKLKTAMTNNVVVFWTKGKHKNNTKKKNNINTLARAGNRIRDLSHQVECVTSGRSSKLIKSIKVKLFNCFSVKPNLHVRCHQFLSKDTGITSLNVIGYRMYDR